MVLNAGQLNRIIQIQRATETPDGAGGRIRTWADHGPQTYAMRRDVSDSERMRASAWQNKLVTRFTIRASTFGRSIQRTDRLVHEGITFEIDGIKELPGSRAFIEITAQTEDAA